MPALTQYVDGYLGPLWKAALVPVPTITIACGAVSGFTPISSGTTPKLLACRLMFYLGYGAMLMVLVAVMALVAASIG